MDSQVKSIIKEALNLYASRGIDDEMFYTEDRDIFIFVRSGGMVAQTILPIGDSFAEFEVTHYNLHPNSIAEIVQTAIMHREIMLTCIKALNSKGWSVSAYRPFFYKGVAVERDGEKALLTDLTTASVTIEGDGFEAVVEDLHQSGILRDRRFMTPRVFTFSNATINAAVNALD